MWAPARAVRSPGLVPSDGVWSSRRGGGGGRSSEPPPLCCSPHAQASRRLAPRRLSLALSASRSPLAGLRQSSEPPWAAAAATYSRSDPLRPRPRPRAHCYCPARASLSLLICRGVGRSAEGKAREWGTGVGGGRAPRSSPRPAPSASPRSAPASPIPPRDPVAERFESSLRRPAAAESPPKLPARPSWRLSFFVRRPPSTSTRKESLLVC